MKNMVDAKQTYQDSAVRGATPIELVIVLYDSAIQDLRRALAAMEGSDVETRSTAINHSLMILQQLQGTLDFERGGGPARQFEQFYNVIRAKILEAQMRGSPELMRQQLRSMTEVRDCWIEAERLLQPAAEATGSVMAAAAMEGSPRSEWNA